MKKEVRLLLDFYSASMYPEQKPFVALENLFKHSTRISFKIREICNLMEK